MATCTTSLSRLRVKTRPSTTVFFFSLRGVHEVIRPETTDQAHQRCSSSTHQVHRQVSLSLCLFFHRIFTGLHHPSCIAAIGISIAIQSSRSRVQARAPLSFTARRYLPLVDILAGLVFDLPAALNSNPVCCSMFFCF
jgi:hypothetical protein